MVVLTVTYSLTHPGAKLPTHGTDESAGWDLYLPEEFRVGPEPSLVNLGLRIELPREWEGSIRPRSSLYKRDIWIPNSPATIDSDYRGDIHIVLVSHRYTTLSKGERVAQLLFSRVPRVNWVLAGEGGLSPTNRGSGGFGSTGK